MDNTEMRNKPLFNNPSSNLTNRTSPMTSFCMFFFVFYGISLLIIFVSAITGFQKFEIFGLPADKHSVLAQLLISPLFLYVLYRGLRSIPFGMFLRISWPIVLLWLFICLRYYSQSLEIGGHAWFTRKFVVVIPAMAFAIPMNANSLKKGFLGFYSSAILLGIFFVVIWSSPIIGGVSMRNYDFFHASATQKVMQTLWASDTGAPILHLGLLGPFIGLTSLWLWHRGKTGFMFFLLTYLLGTVLLFFTGSRLPVMIWAVMHCFILLSNFSSYTLRKYAILLLIILINTSLLFHFERHKNGSLMTRMSTLKNEIATTMEADWTPETTTVAPSDLTPKAAQTGEIEKNKTPEKTATSTPKNDSPEKAPTSTPKNDSPKKAPTSTPKNDSPPKTSSTPPKSNPPEKIKLATARDYDPLYLEARKSKMDTRMYIYCQSIVTSMEHPFGSRFLVPIHLPHGDRLFDPHSSILVILLGTGYLGLLLFAYICGRGIIDALLVFYRQPDYGWITVCLFIAMLTHVFNGIGFFEAPFWCLLTLLRAQVMSGQKTIGDNGNGDTNDAKHSEVYNDEDHAK